eukprot:UN28771
MKLDKFSDIFINEGYDDLSLFDDLSKEDLESLGFKGGHLRKWWKFYPAHNPNGAVGGRPRPTKSRPKAAVNMNSFDVGSTGVRPYGSKTSNQFDNGASKVRQYHDNGGSKVRQFEPQQQPNNYYNYNNLPPQKILIEITVRQDWDKRISCCRGNLYTRGTKQQTLGTKTIQKHIGQDMMNKLQIY